MRRQRILLLDAFDPLGDDRQTQGPGESDDRARDHFVVGVGQQIPHEGLVDLQLIERQLLQVRQRRVTRAEVVEGKAHAPCLQGTHLGDDVLDIVEQHALGELQLEIARVRAASGENGQHLVDEVRLPKLPGTDVDRNRETLPPRPGGPQCRLGAGGLQHPQTEGQDQAGFLGNRDELGGRDGATLLMLPA